MKKEVVKIGRYIEFEHEDGICENMLLLTEKETNAMEKQLKKSYEYEQQIEQLTNNWNELEEYIKNHYIVGHTIQNASLDDILRKMKEIKEQSNDKSKMFTLWRHHRK